MASDKGGAGKGPRSGIDIATIGGLLVAVGGIVGGLIMEGGKVQDVAQVSAGVIVLAGTIGAVMVTTPLDILLRAMGRLPSVFFPKHEPTGEVMEQIIGFAAQARKQGIVSLERQAQTVSDPFLRKALNLAVDGIELSQIRKMLDLEIAMIEHDGEAEAKVFEAAGGYSPTIGIIGAVLGLIQVMKNLANIDEVGRGIAVAFVATVYGVGVANIVFLPAASKLRSRVQEKVHAKEMMLEGVVSIVEGLNPKLIRLQLEAYERKGKEKASKGARGAASVETVAAEG